MFYPNSSPRRKLTVNHKMSEAEASTTSPGESASSSTRNSLRRQTLPAHNTVSNDHRSVSSVSPPRQQLSVEKETWTSSLTGKLKKLTGLGKAASREDHSPTSSIPREPVMIGSAQLNTLQVRSLVANWSHLNKVGPGGIGTIIFNKLLQKNSSLREMFSKATIVNSMSGSSHGATNNCLKEHGNLAVHMIDHAVQHIDRIQETAALCQEYGAAHVNLDIRGQNLLEAHLWDTFGQSMMEAFTQLDVVRKRKELMRAWIILISFLVDNLRSGYTTALRAERTRQSFLITSPDRS